MISLVFSACLLSGDHHCENKQVKLDDKATVQSCLLTAHQKALDWQRDHATYMVVGWHCKDDKLSEGEHALDAASDNTSASSSPSSSSK